MSGEVLRCSSKDCTEAATETLFLRNQVGHTHDCTPHAAQVREWCDAISSSQIVDNVCQAGACTGNAWIWYGQPTPLAEPHARIADTAEQEEA